VHVLELDDSPELSHGESTALTDRSDAWLSSRAGEILALIQVVDFIEHKAMLAEFEEILAEVKHRGEPWIIARMLRGHVIARLVNPRYAHKVDPVIDDLLSHSERHGLAIFSAAAHTMRARRYLMEPNEDRAISEVAKALAIMDEGPEPPVTVNHRTHSEALSSVLVDIGLVLIQLGIYEVADEVMMRAHSAVKDNGNPHSIAVHMLNRAKLLINWAFRLERVNKQAEAKQRLATATAIAKAAERPYKRSLFSLDSSLPVADQVAVIAVAYALNNPTPAHIARLEKFLNNPVHAKELVIITLALARCMDADGQTEAAKDLLISVAQQATPEKNETACRLSLIRETAVLSAPNGDPTALEYYVAELESAMWGNRQGIITTLETRREHEKLARTQGAIEQAARQDPLTGLANRRALDERLLDIAKRPNETMSIALIDLDGFKGVNDRLSHAEGDEVLRMVARAIREALRGDDFVTRYGGDEFVVLLPGASLRDAKLALQRAVEGIANLPQSTSHGVTLSVGVVALRSHEAPTSALSRADAAMYRAKRAGGNAVESIGNHEELPSEYPNRFLDRDEEPEAKPGADDQFPLVEVDIADIEPITAQHHSMSTGMNTRVTWVLPEATNQAT
jgi:diguanylate cyclase (GGDEF)-like protein